MIRIEGFRKALKAAINGPSIKDVKWTRNDHDFNVKKVAITKTSSGLEIDGSKGKHISHRKRGLPDDQVFYRVKVAKDGSVTDLDIDIKSTAEILTNWLKEVGEIVKAIGELLKEADQKADGGPVDLLKNAQPTPGSQQLLKGNWEGDMQMMIANIIHFAVATEMPEVAKGAK